jgi:hypothetical protein
MISTTSLQKNFGDLSGNDSTSNLARGLFLMNIEQRYLLQKYFNNETSYTITTIGGQSLTLTGTLAIGTVSATLTSSWAYPTTYTTVTFSDGEQRNALLTNGSTAITWVNGLIGTNFVLTGGLSTGATSATLLSFWPYATQTTLTQFSDGETKTVTYTLNSTAISWSGGLAGAVNNTIFTSIITTALGVGGVQFYNLPPDYSKLKTETLTIGSLKWTPDEIMSRMQWDKLNVFPYYSDIPSKFFIWNGQFGIWPIPSTTGNIITFNYKRRVPDLSIVDYSAGTVSITIGTNTVTGSGTNFPLTMSTVGESRWIQFAQPTGDNLWYQIYSVNSATSITLVGNYQGATISGVSAYTIGQMPVLMEDFQDMLLWKALVIYYSSGVGSNKEKKDEFAELYDQKLELLAEYAGTKTINVNLSPKRVRGNPNLFQSNISL